jgi:predicted metal-binding membrane protein
MNPERAWLGTAALVFAASAAVTVLWCGSMSGMPGMDMPGGWTMSMAWMRMPEQTWPGAATTFLGMWTVMMLAMMLPVLVPALARYRQGVRRKAGARLGRLTLVVASGYFLVWALAGLVAYPLGVLWSELAMRSAALSRAVPLLTALVVTLAGALQFTRWKQRQLACCRGEVDCCLRLAATAGAAWRHGWRLGVRCVYCCAGLNAVLLVIGVMDLLAMALTMIAISAERLAPGGRHVAWAVGGAMLAAGVGLLVRAMQVIPLP